MKARLLAAMLLVLPLVAAAEVYKWVGPDGKVTYSDSPPPAGAKAVERRAGGAGGGSESANLPYALQQAVNSHPVTLFTTRDCQPCEEARQLLARRGVPAREQTITSREDLAELKTIAGSTQLPVLRVGRELQRGFDADAWQQALSSAGYPEQSRLPAGWRNAQATPLAPRAAPAPKAETPAREAITEAPSPANAPPGFRF